MVLLVSSLVEDGLAHLSTNFTVCGKETWKWECRFVLRTERPAVTQYPLAQMEEGSSHTHRAGENSVAGEIGLFSDKHLPMAPQFKLAHSLTLHTRLWKGQEGRLPGAPQPRSLVKSSSFWSWWPKSLSSSLAPSHRGLAHRPQVLPLSWVVSGFMWRSHVAELLSQQPDSLFSHYFLFHCIRLQPPTRTQAQLCPLFLKVSHHGDIYTVLKLYCFRYKESPTS